MDTTAETDWNTIAPFFDMDSAAHYMTYHLDDYQMAQESTQLVLPTRNGRSSGTDSGSTSYRRSPRLGHDDIEEQDAKRPRIDADIAAAASSLPGHIDFEQSIYNVVAEELIDHLQMHAMLNGPPGSVIDDGGVTPAIASFYDQASARLDNLALSAQLLMERVAHMGPRPRAYPTRAMFEAECRPIFDYHPSPPDNMLCAAVTALSMRIPHASMALRRRILSDCRAWFRKRRESMGVRITSMMRRTNTDAAAALSMLSNGTLNVPAFARRANLPPWDSQVAAQFIRQKLVALVSRR